MENDLNLVVFTVEPCPPCSILLEALEKIQLTVNIDVQKANASDKQAMGRMLLAGITQFPTVKLHRGGACVWSMSGITQSDSPESIARKIEQAICTNWKE